MLKKHWPHVPIISDIHDMQGGEYGTVDLVSGGPPCQKTSVAAAITGNRTGESLWPEMERVIRFANPVWVIIEQPSGNKEWENTVKVALESLSYSSEKFEFKASDCGAPHPRKRVFFIANTSRERLSSFARLRKPLSFNKVSWPTPPRGAWRSTRTGNCRMDDGVSDWVHRLKALGNAIVPQVAAEIMRTMKDVDDGKERA